MTTVAHAAHIADQVFQQRQFVADLLLVKGPGAAGRLGRRLAAALGTSHELVLGDIKRLDDPRFICMDITDMTAVRAALRSVDAIVHTVILDWPDCSAEESLRYAVPSLQVHVIGVHNVLHAAWEMGVQRFVFTSSLSAVDGIPPDTPVGSDTRHYSNNIYGMGKGLGEDICRMFHHAFGLSVAVLRLGNIFLPEARGAWLGNTYVPDLSAVPALEPSPSRVHVDDVTLAIALALEAPDPGYALVHVVGAGSGNRWDLETAGRVYGWKPRYAFGADGLPRDVGASVKEPELLEGSLRRVDANKAIDGD